MAAPAENSNIKIVINIAELVTNWTGNRFLEKHYAMIESRLTRRLLQLKLGSLQEYYMYLTDHEDDEKEHLISLLTTHHTYFFRESAHFDYIKDDIIPKIAAEVLARPDKTLRILSMACSKGHEVYSLATFLDYNLKKMYPNMNFHITANDIDSQSVDFAKNGVYLFQELKRVPLQYLEGYWMRGKGDISDFAKVRNEIKSKCTFYPENLLNISPQTKSQKFDIILCRNVFIYFDHDKILEITKSLSSMLSDVGYLIVGISESLRGINDNLDPVGPSVYRPKLKVVPKSAPAPMAPAAKAPVAPIPPAAPAAKAFEFPNPIRVLCVDDSPTIHAVLGKILSEGQGFKVVGKAMNGKEAIDFLSKNKVDAVTLDIHMPEMNGIEFLEKNFGPNHPPVVMMTSVTRENSDLAFRALSLGASDYVEKPTLHNMKEISQELIMKIKGAIQNSHMIKDKKFDKQFAKHLEIKTPDSCLNIVYGSILERDKVKELIAKSVQTKIDTIVVWNTAKPDDETLISSFFQQWGMPAEYVKSNGKNHLQFAFNTNELYDYLKNKTSKTKVVISTTALSTENFLNQPPVISARYILEESNQLNLSKVKKDWNVYPFTSMEYTIFEVFAK